MCCLCSGSTDSSNHRGVIRSKDVTFTHDCKINQLSRSSGLTSGTLCSCQNRPTCALTRDYCQSVESELWENCGLVYRSVPLSFVGTCPPLWLIQHTAPSGWIFFFFCTSPANRFRLFLCGKRRPSSWNLFSASKHKHEGAARRFRFNQHMIRQLKLSEQTLSVNQPI